MSIPATIRRDLRDLDEAARDGRNRLLTDGAQFAVGKWHDNAWRFPNGHPLDFTPDRYRP